MKVITHVIFNVKTSVPVTTSAQLKISTKRTKAILNIKSSAKQ